MSTIGINTRTDFVKYHVKKLNSDAKLAIVDCLRDHQCSPRTTVDIGLLIFEHPEESSFLIGVAALKTAALMKSIETDEASLDALFSHKQYAKDVMCLIVDRPSRMKGAEVEGEKDFLEETYGL